MSHVSCQNPLSGDHTSRAKIICREIIYCVKIISRKNMQKSFVGKSFVGKSFVGKSFVGKIVVAT
jgi:hypothetical protein